MGDSIACHRCGQMLDSESAFCPHCGAPQIRVTVPEAEVIEDASLPVRPVADVKGIQWPRAFMAVFLPAVIASAALLVPILVYGALLWVGIAGFFSVRMYRRRAQSAWIDSGVGAKLGAAVGLLCGVFAVILVCLDFAWLAASGHSVQAALLDQLRNGAAHNPNPNSQAVIDQLSKNPQMMLPVIAISIAFMVVVFLVCGTVGGAIAGGAEARRPRSR
jgi:hypothetical protein